MMMGRCGVGIDAHESRIDVNDRIGEIGDVMEEFVLRDLSHRMSARDRHATLDAEADLRHESMARPPCSNFGDGHDALHPGHGLGDARNDSGVDGVEKSLPDTADRLKANDQYGGRDEQSHDGVGPAQTEGNGNGPGQNEERSHPIGAGVNTVGLQRGGPDTTPHADAVLSDNLIAHGPDNGGGHDEAEVSDLFWMQKSMDRLVAGETS